MKYIIINNLKRVQKNKGPFIVSITLIFLSMIVANLFAGAAPTQLHVVAIGIPLETSEHIVVTQAQQIPSKNELISGRYDAYIIQEYGEITVISRSATIKTTIEEILRGETPTQKPEQQRGYASKEVSRWINQFFLPVLKYPQIEKIHYPLLFRRNCLP